MTAIKLTLEHSVSHTGSNTKQLLTYRALNLKSQWCTHTHRSSRGPSPRLTLTSRARTREEVLPLPVSVHQDPNQDASNSHQDGVVVHALQPCRRNRVHQSGTTANPTG